MTMFVLKFLCFAIAVKEALGVGRVISDWRVRNQEVTPVLGRGYSMSTGTLQSSCLAVEAKTTPSYDYDYSFVEINETNETELNQAFSGKLTSSLSFLWVSSEIETSLSKKTVTLLNAKKRFLIATMRMDRYYVSVDEVESELIDDARTLLDNGEFMSFFQG